MNRHGYSDLNHPFVEVAASAEDVIARGGKIFQKWTCAKCGERVTMNVPDVFYTQGLHEDCGGVTNLLDTGCNFLAVYSKKEVKSV